MKKKVTFVFQGGRSARINGKDSFAKDMFYTYFKFKENHDVEIIEFQNYVKEGKFYKLIFYFQGYVRRFIKIPLYSIYLTNKKNYKILSESDHIILSTNRIATSVLPMLLRMRFRRKKNNVTFFILGLFSSVPKYRVLKMLQSIFYFFLFLITDNIVFIGYGEYKYALSQKNFFKKKYSYVPFGVDVDFWNDGKVKDNSNKKGILFVGNDSNRDFELVKKISSQMKNIDFTLVTSEIDTKEVGDNVIIHKGNWGNPAISDSELRDLYRRSRLTIIPLKESLQPSGQSVALQSMSTGTPVLITKTEGLWDTEKLVDGKNIVLLEDNSLKTWVEKINNLYSNPLKLDELSSNSKIDVKKYFSIENFYDKLIQTIDL
tara:strand:- start:12557 stop:13678 length:1122 start_codon:yes stop_codon:yes gene_type:complete